jgi:hypothetical protein
VLGRTPSVPLSLSLSPSFSSFHQHIPPQTSSLLLSSQHAHTPPLPLVSFIASSRATPFVFLEPQTHTTWGEMFYNLPVSPLLIKHTMTTVPAPDGLAALERHVHVAVAALVVDGAGCGVDGAGGLVGGGGLLGLVG